MPHPVRGRVGMPCLVLMKKGIHVAFPVFVPWFAFSIPLS